jgi:N-methylhydantoinase A
VLVAFGGAGPVHAALLAQELRIPRVLVPASPGVHSAMGLLVSDLKRDYIQTHFAALESIDVAEVQRRFAEMEAVARQEFESQGVGPDQITHERAVDLRYSIQKYELPVAVSPGDLDPEAKSRWRAAFDEVHEKHFGSRAEDQRVEIVNYRLTTRVIVPKPAVSAASSAGEQCDGAITTRRKAYFDAWYDCPIYDRRRLRSGNRLRGPAIVEQMDSTTVIHPGQRAEIDGFGNIVIEINGGD